MGILQSTSDGIMEKIQVLGERICKKIENKIEEEIKTNYVAIYGKMIMCFYYIAKTVLGENDHDVKMLKTLIGDSRIIPELEAEQKKLQLGQRTTKGKSLFCKK